MVDFSQTQTFSGERPKKGIKVSDGENYLHENIILDSGARIDVKVPAKDTNGDLSILLSSNNVKASGPPLHIHPDFDETFYITKGEVKFQVGEDIFSLKVGDSIFIPRNIPHAFTITSELPAAFLIVSQPAGKFEDFLRAYSKFDKITPEIAAKLMSDHNMKVVGPPLIIH